MTCAGTRSQKARLKLCLQDVSPGNESSVLTTIPTSTIKTQTNKTDTFKDIHTQRSQRLGRGDEQQWTDGDVGQYLNNRAGNMLNN